MIASCQFALIYAVTLIKTASNFYYSCEMKQFGLILLGNDKFVTDCISYGLLMSFCMRLSMGVVFKLLGLKVAYLVNLVLEITGNTLLSFGGERQLYFFLFIVCNRVSSGGTLLANGRHDVHPELHHVRGDVRAQTRD